jgi:hypothetical protein
MTAAKAALAAKTSKRLQHATNIKMQAMNKVKAAITTSWCSMLCTNNKAMIEEVNRIQDMKTQHTLPSNVNDSSYSSAAILQPILHPPCIVASDLCNGDRSGATCP